MELKKELVVLIINPGNGMNGKAILLSHDF